MRRCKYCGAWIGFVQRPGERPVPVEPRSVVVRPGRGTENFLTGEGAWILGERTLAGPVGGNLAVFVPHRRYCRGQDERGGRQS